MQISVEVPFSIDMFISLRKETPPDGVVIHLPPMEEQRGLTSFIVWDPITIEVAKFGATTVAIPFFVNCLFDKFKDASPPPKVTIRRREIRWERGEIQRAIAEEIEIESK